MGEGDSGDRRSLGLERLNKIRNFHLFPYPGICGLLDAHVRSSGWGLKNPRNRRSASTATMPPNRPNGRGGGGACLGRLFGGG